MKVVFTFSGGFMDQQTVDGTTDISDPANEAKRYLFLTNSGTVGTRFREYDPQILKKVLPDSFEDQFFDTVRSLQSGSSILEVIDHLRAANPEFAEEANLKHLMKVNASQVYEVITKSVDDDQLVIRLAQVDEDVDN